MARGATARARGCVAEAHVRRRVCVVCKAPLEQNTTGRPRLTCKDACKQKRYRRKNRRPRTTLEVMGSSRSDEWPTEPQFFATLDARFGPFTLDPCSTAENAKCERFFTRADNGLTQEWTGRVFMNPPYGKTIGAWMRKAWEASQSTAELVVCLVPARTDTRWWHDYATLGEIEFVRGRLRFGDGRHPAPFPSAVVVFRNACGRYESPPFRLVDTSDAAIKDRAA
jgi:phage N-6-adenine-methyltransferase